MGPKAKGVKGGGSVVGGGELGTVVNILALGLLFGCSSIAQREL